MIDLKRIKERTMRLELEKINKETERYTKEYEEKISFKYLFDNYAISKNVKKDSKTIITHFYYRCFYFSIK